MKKAIDFFTAHPARFFLLAALLWGGVMFLISIKMGKFDLDGLLTEANGMVFDLLVFGVLLSIYERLREKKDKIERLHEEIDDYRGWDEKEAMYRIVGAVRRLNKLGETKITLGSCFLKKANLEKVNLSEANLSETNLSWANLEKANLQGANLSRADISNANLMVANLTKTKFSGANLSGAVLIEANLTETNLSGANLCAAVLINTKLSGARFTDSSLTLSTAVLGSSSLGNLSGAFVGHHWFEKLEEWQVKGREEIKQKYLIDENGVLREKQ